jgi:hypothetical protein
VTNRAIAQLQGRRIIKGNTSRAAQQAKFEKDQAEHAAALKRIWEGGVATKVRILANHDCCPVCNAVEGAYEFDEVPELPLEGCSHPQGCRCHYAPVLDRFGP